MANELNIALAKSGLTVTAQRYQSGAAVGSAISCPETGSTGFYSGNMTGTAGTYQVAFISASANVGSGSIVWDGTAEVASSAPSVVQIRQELDSNSTKLANLDTTVSSRLAPNGTLATVTTLTNAPTVPTAAAIASQVRTELATELGRVDQAISSRLAGSAYTAPANSDVAAIKAKTDALPSAPAAVSNIPTAAQNASATRSELSVELARVDQAISTRATPANIPTADIAAIKAKTDAVNVDRINNTATLSQVGNLLAQANS